MKYLFLLSLFLLSTLNYAQTTAKEEGAKKLVVDFFEAFHEQDTLVLRKFAHQDAILQSIAVSEENEAELTTYSYSELLKRIASFPETTNFEEVLHDFEISIHGKLANVSTPFSFFLNGEFSHCGVNTFQLMKLEGNWKIIYLVDTRQRQGCEN